MSLREKINQNPQLGVGLGVGVLVIAIVLLIYTMRGKKELPAPDFETTKGFFSDDDGKTWFVDDLTNIPPFDHNGKKAYRAKMFIAANGQKFVGWLEGYDPAQKKHLETEMNKNQGELPDRILHLEHPNVKKPGSGIWVRYGLIASPEYNKIIGIQDPPDHNVDGYKEYHPTAADMKPQS